MTVEIDPAEGLYTIQDGVGVAVKDVQDNFWSKYASQEAYQVLQDHRPIGVYGVGEPMARVARFWDAVVDANVKMGDLINAALARGDVILISKESMSGVYSENLPGWATLGLDHGVAIITDAPGSPDYVRIAASPGFAWVVLYAPPGFSVLTSAPPPIASSSTTAAIPDAIAATMAPPSNPAPIPTEQPAATPITTTNGAQAPKKTIPRWLWWTGGIAAVAGLGVAVWSAMSGSASNPTPERWVVRADSERDEDTGEPLFWCNVDGWVDLHSAASYAVRSGTLPIGGSWVTWQDALAEVATARRGSANPVQMELFRDEADSAPNPSGSRATAADRKFDEHMGKLFLELGAKKVEPPSEYSPPSYIFETKYGPLTLTPYGDWIAGRFKDPKAAVAAGLGRLNPYSGKWNHHLATYVAGTNRPKRVSLEDWERHMRFELSYVMGAQENPSPYVKQNYGSPNPVDIVDVIRPGDRVTIVDRFGQKSTGRAVMRSSHGGWVLNMGGKHGTPGLADASNIVGVKPARASRENPTPEHSGGGFAVVTYSQDHVEQNAAETFGAEHGDPDDRAKAMEEGYIDAEGDITEEGWEVLTKDVQTLERNSLAWLSATFHNARGEGHDDDVLVGTFWFDNANKQHLELIELGMSERIDMSDASFGDLSKTVWTGVSWFGQSILGGHVTFMLDEDEKTGFEEALEAVRA